MLRRREATKVREVEVGGVIKGQVGDSTEEWGGWGEMEWGPGEDVSRSRWGISKTAWAVQKEVGKGGAQKAKWGPMHTWREEQCNP